MSEHESYDASDTAWLKSQKRKKVAGVGLAVTVAAGILSLALAWINRPPPKCDPKETQSFLTHSRLPNEMVGMVCELPESLQKALKGSAAAPPSMRSVFWAQAVVETPDLLSSVCPGGLEGLQQAIQAKPENKSKAFLSKCDLSSYPLSMSMLEASDFEDLLLATTVYGAVKDDGDRAVKVAHRILKN